jgi:hypothetical protein
VDEQISQYYKEAASVRRFLLIGTNLAGFLLAATMTTASGCRSHDVNGSPIPQSLAGSKATNARSGRIMTTNKPIAFYQSELLEDVAAITVGDVGYLVTVEHTFDVIETSNNLPLEKSNWRFWQFVQNADFAGFHEESKSIVDFPIATSVSMALIENRLLVLAEVNQGEPMLLLSWKVASTPPLLNGLQPKTTPVRLNHEQAEQVRIQPKDDWSTSGLKSSRWLFHPSLTRTQDGLALSMNTANGRAVIWRMDGDLGGDGNVKPFASIPQALNPVLTQISKNLYLVYRQMPDNWSVFFHDTRYSAQFGPVALPLILAKMEDSGTIAEPFHPAKNQVLQDVFDFVVSNGEKGRVALAAIVGSKEKLELRIFAIEGPDVTLRLLHSVPIHEVPYRLTMAVLSDGLLLGLAQTQRPGHEVSGLFLPWL